MYHMKNIIDHSEEITLPKCMYPIRNPNESLKDELDDLQRKIRNQVKKFLKAPFSAKMSELEQRQEVLIKKLDILYDRIKTISSYCNLNKSGAEHKVLESTNTTGSVPAPDEVVLGVNPDNLPWFLNKILKEHCVFANVSWHIHSSVPNEKVPKIKAFIKGLKIKECQPKINIRLIFKSVSANSELKLSSLMEPIVGIVNILRYLSYAYPNAIHYDDNDFQMDSLLDICHLLENAPDKIKDNLIKQLFTENKDWIYGNKFTIVDLAAFNIVKQSKSGVKCVPKVWLEKCEKLCMPGMSNM